MRAKPSPRRFSTPITIGTASNTETEDRKSVDEEIDTYLGDRRSRLLEEAKLAELEHVTEEEKTGAARARQERQRVEKGESSSTGEEESMEDTEKKVEDAAEVAAQAASAGVEPEQATDLGTGKAKVVVIKPGGGGGEPIGEGKGGWAVIDGKPVKDPEGEYTFNQALKVAAVEKAKGSSDPLAVFKWMKEEGLLTGPKGDEYMSKFTAELAHKSVESLVGNKSGSSDIEALRSDLGTQINSLRQELREATDPVAAARRVKDVYDSFKSVGLITQGTSGKSDAEFKHDERMEEIKADREHNDRLTDLAEKATKNIGRGIGEDMRRGHEGRPRTTTTLEEIICEECGTKFPVSPEAQEKGEATCPKCGQPYRAEK